MRHKKVLFIHKRTFSDQIPNVAMNFEGINRLPNVGQGRRLAEMKQEDPDMMKALEEDLMDFHGRIEKSSTWWCPRMQDTTTTTKKKVVAARINFQSYHPRIYTRSA